VAHGTQLPAISPEVRVTDLGHHALISPLLAAFELVLDVLDQFLNSSQCAGLRAAQCQSACSLESSAAALWYTRKQRLKVLRIVSYHDPLININPLRQQDIS
jgi:hypothetical protein